MQPSMSENNAQSAAAMNVSFPQNAICFNSKRDPIAQFETSRTE